MASEEDKHALIAADPTVFFTTPHYDGYPAVLVRLAEVAPDKLSKLVIEAWRLRAPKRDVTRWDQEHPAPA